MGKFFELITKNILTRNSDRVEVDWKYILKLHPDESQRPKPSANAKPLPEHLKETDASLDITNRTDGVPDIGDAFHDPNSVQKWAEWHTAPEVTQKVAKVDFSKENRLWYYLGKPSTEARPQYTEDPSKPRHNTKSNFLDTVKPPPPPVPAFAQRSYPASYPLKPSPIAIHSGYPTHHQMQSSGRPYQYKPKETYMASWKSPVYNPDTRKNPNSPVAHQPNVSYDHRPPSQGNGQAPQQGYQHPRPSPQYQYHPYVPPQAHSTWKAQPASSGPLLTGIDQYAHAPQSKAMPTYPHSQSSSHGSHQLPPYPYSQSSGQTATPVYNPPVAYNAASQAPAGQAPLPNLLSNPTGPPKPPMYAITPSSSVVCAASSPTEYLAYVMKYPYLKNAYLRRAKTYVSPYSPGGGFTQAWMPNPPASGSAAPTPTGPVPPQGHYSGQAPASLPISRPTAQFQSSDAFQRDMARTSQPADGAPKWEQMLKQLATSTGSAAPATATAATQSLQQPTLIAPPNADLAHGVTKDSTEAEGRENPTLPQKELQRPIPSPISDDGNRVAGESSAERKSALSQVHGGETWRYS